MPFALLLEDGSALLLESGDRLLIEATAPGPILGTGDPDPAAFEIYAQGPDPYLFIFDWE